MMVTPVDDKKTFDDYQASQALPGEAFVLVSNAAKVESKGVEFDIAAALTDHLSMDASVALVESEYDNFENAPCARPSQPGCANGTQDLAGSRLDNAPRVTANLGLGYQAALQAIDGLDWFARLDASCKSSAHLHVSQDDQTRQGGYTLYNSQIGVETADAQWRVALWGRNLGDKSYTLTSESDVGSVTRIQGVPRTCGLTVEWSF